MMNNKGFYPNYIKCPDCNNILDLSFIDKSCPNPLCGFNFDGLNDYLNKNDEELRKIYLTVYKNRESREYKLVITAIKYNMGNYLAHYIECSSGAHYNTLYKDFILNFLDDLNILKIVLKSDVIKEKDNVIVSKNAYKIFWDLFKKLMNINCPEIRKFLRLEFPALYKKYYKERHEKFMIHKVIMKSEKQSKLI